MIFGRRCQRTSYLHIISPLRRSAALSIERITLAEEEDPILDVRYEIQHFTPITFQCFAPQGILLCYLTCRCNRGHYCFYMLFSTFCFEYRLTSSHHHTALRPRLALVVSSHFRSGLVIMAFLFADTGTLRLLKCLLPL